jgi:hypothetical protein
MNYLCNFSFIIIIRATAKISAMFWLTLRDKKIMAKQIFFLKKFYSSSVTVVSVRRKSGRDQKPEIK